MIWFSEDVLTTEMIFENYLSRLKSIPIDEGDEDSMSLIPQPVSSTPGSAVDQFISPSLQVFIKKIYIFLYFNIFKIYLASTGYYLNVTTTFIF